MMSTDTLNNNNFITGYLPVNGLQMYYEIHGKENNDPLVLIHGGGSTLNTSFGKLIPVLSKNNKIIAVELQAHGRTSDRDAPESFEQDAEDVVTLLHQLQINKASFFGFSNGGTTAMQIGIQHPQIVSKLILASTVYKREGLLPGFFEGMAGATIDHMPQVLKTAFLEVNPNPGQLENMFRKDKQRMLDFKDWKDEDLQSIKAPTLIINGDRDVILAAHSVEMAKLIENSRLMILPSEHGSYMGVLESPAPSDDLFHMTMNIIEDFLQG